MVYFGALCTTEISVVLTEVRWPQEAPITAHPLRGQGNLKRKVNKNNLMEEGFCDLVSLTGAWPQKPCWEGTSVVLIYEHFFLAYDSELRCSQENRKEKENGLSCFIMFCKGWWFLMMRLGCVDSGQSKGQGWAAIPSLNLDRNIP